MTTDHRLPTPRFRIFMRDGQELYVQALNVDQLAWDRTAAKHGWPAAQVAPLTWATFVAWSAARREKLIDGMTWEQFSESECIAVQTNPDDATDDDAEGAGADPTLRDPAPV
jgi:hypothetical protein